VRQLLPIPAISHIRLFVWPLVSGLLLAFACYYWIRASHPVHLTGDFCSHTLYLSFIVLASALFVWRGFRGQEKRQRWWPLTVSLAVLLSVELLKLATRLPRPDGRHDGFPSGHTTYVFALAWLLAQAFPRLSPLWYGVAVSVGWSRVEGHAHFPYQVLWGAFLGTIIGACMSHFKRRLPLLRLFRRSPQCRLP